jgi:hypothetical protein
MHYQFEEESSSEEEEEMGEGGEEEDDEEEIKKKIDIFGAINYQTEIIPICLLFIYT